MQQGSGSRRQFDGTDTRYAALLRETTSIVWDMPANGEFQRRQLDWESYTGQSVDEYAGMGWLNAVADAERARVAEEWRANIESAMPFDMQYSLRRSDGEYRAMQIHVTPVMDDATGRVREWIGAHSDITRHREIEHSLRGTLAKLESANRELMEASDAKSAFLATMSHELRTPLNAMIGYSELLLLGIPEQPSALIRPHIERIDLSARHLLQLIEEVLTFSRIEAGSERVHFELVRLSDVMREVNAVMMPIVNAKSIRFVIDAPTEPIDFVTDPRKIRQILVNLLGNAAKFTEKGQITLSASVDGDTLVLSVADTGIGIAADNLQKIFDPFWQVDHGKTRAVGGTGLGLAVTRELAAIMGGDVRVESKMGVGSTFTVTLPLNQNRSR